MSPEEYILERVEVDPRSGCWEWKLKERNHGRGYRRASYKGQTWQAHRFAYHHLVGFLHKSEVVHHTCSNRACVNPEHLQKVSPHENVAEMLGRRVYEEEIVALRMQLDEALTIIEALEGFLDEGEGYE